MAQCEVRAGVLKAYDSVSAARADIADYLNWYNATAPFEPGRITPDEQYFAALPRLNWLPKMPRLCPELPTASVRRKRRPPPWTTLHRLQPTLLHLNLGGLLFQTSGALSVGQAP